MKLREIVESIIIPKTFGKKKHSFIYLYKNIRVLLIINDESILNSIS